MTDQKLLGAQWLGVAKSLGIECICPFFIRDENGTLHEFSCLIPQFGGGLGTLITSEYAKEAYSAATAQGYMISSMSPETRHLPLNHASYMDCLIDWGWSCESIPAPAWYVWPE